MGRCCTRRPVNDMSRDGALTNFLQTRLRLGMRTCSHCPMTAADSADGALARSQAARRRRVIDATLELAAGGGFDGVQMRDVAAEAGVALGTVYRYFESKERLLLEANLEQVDALRARISEHPPKGVTPADRVVDV